MWDSWNSLISMSPTLVDWVKPFKFNLGQFQRIFNCTSTTIFSHQVKFITDCRDLRFSDSITLLMWQKLSTNDREITCPLYWNPLDGNCSYPQNAPQKWNFHWITSIIHSSPRLLRIVEPMIIPNRRQWLSSEKYETEGQRTMDQTHINFVFIKFLYTI